VPLVGSSTTCSTSSPVRREVIDRGRVDEAIDAGMTSLPQGPSKGPAGSCLRNRENIVDQSDRIRLG